MATVTRRYRFEGAEGNTMASRSGRLGTWWETQIVNEIRKWNPYAERRARSGSKDRGDIAGIPGWVIEAKYGAKRADFPGWWREAETERENDGAEFAAVWQKRVGKQSALDGWVIMDGATFLRLLAAAQFLPARKDEVK
jgi:hypothetical protein